MGGWRTRLIWTAHPLRAMVEAVGLEVVLLILLMNSTANRMLVGVMLAWFSMICVLWAALRMDGENRPIYSPQNFPPGVKTTQLPKIKPAEGARKDEPDDSFQLDGHLRWYGFRVLANEVIWAVLLAGAMQGVALLVTGVSVQGTAWDESLPIGIWLFIIVPITFLPLRLVMHLWRVWNAIRQRRLLWSIIHAQLITTVIVVAVLLIREGILTASQPQTPLEVGVVRQITLLTILVFGAIVAIPFVGVIVALSGGISYFTARVVTRRVEALAGAASHLRQGHYDARVSVEGQDEIAQLQADFNAMADQLEQTLSALKNERDRVNKLLQTRRELVASVSHELRTPVATMRGYLESALMNWGDTPPVTLRHDLEIVEHEVTRLQGLIDDLFMLSRAEVGRLTLNPVPVDVGRVIQRVVETSKSLSWDQGKVQVIATPFPADLQVQADAGRLTQILYNLIHNAVRHTPPGGIVAVSAAAEGGQVRIDVQDTGEGIAPKDLPHVWELFYRGRADDGSHAGLGLALVKELVEAMGGSVSAESVVGHGSCFSLYLPIAT
ncbi:MAG: HAMP domain-containing histidine kinase [Anaerolineae bacterium]|nr:HAMP domain-containing histidine kinase [Anaerolineae bacterium]